jgi:hypothetical protein
MSRTLDKIAAEANKTPVKFIMVGLRGILLSEFDEMDYEEGDTTESIIKRIREKYGDRAFGFRTGEYLHGKPVNVTGWTYLGGSVATRDEVVSQNRPDEKILRDNMRINNIPAIIRTGGQCFPFDPSEDTVISLK